MATLLAVVSATAVVGAQEAAEGSHEIHLMDFFWPVVNFAILCWVLYYFLRGPLTTYLRDRGVAIRKDLSEAAALTSQANAQLAEIDGKLKALPGEIDALSQRGRAEIAAEEARIAAAAEAERTRLLEQTRREIDLEVRQARRALTEHAADLAVALASDRIARERTPEDQDRLVNRYLDQVKG
jgi:F-type H+-transporting ATPase subunit b